MAEITSTEIDGVPVCWTELPGPLRAGLTFSAGFCDERFTQSGWTHLVEHLALTPFGMRPHVNGSVGLTSTTFETAGPPEEVAAFLTTVCDSLRDLPTDRLDVERRILAAEAERRGPGVADTLLLYRYGIDGYGAGNRWEYGRHGATAEALRAFARERFVAGAAALWLTGPPPDGLALRLPDGPPLPRPEPRSYAPPGAHWLVETDRAAAGSLVVEGAADVVAFAVVLRDRLVRRLRVEEGISYSPDTTVMRLRGDLLHVTAVVDAAPGEHAGAARGLLAVLDEIAAGAVTAAELAELVPEPGDDHAFEWLLQTAHARRAGRPLPPSPAEAAAAVSPERVAEVAREGLAGLLLAVRTPDPAVSERLAALPVWSPALPGGTVRYRGDDERRRRRLVVTDEGIGVHAGPDRFGTVPWRDLSGVAAWDDGTREVVGADGTVIDVHPADLPDSAGLPALIDGYAGPERVAPQPPVPAKAGVDAAADTARWEREFAAKQQDVRGLRRTAISSTAQLLAVLAGLLAVFAGVLWLLARFVGSGAVGFAVPALVVFLFVSYREHRKQKDET